METKTSSLHCLIYISSATEELSTEELDNILAKSRINNSGLNVTGMLVYSDGNIIQVLEGEKETINSLYDFIKKDSRHIGLIKLLEKPIEYRNFGDWSMGFRAMKVKETTGFKNITHPNDFLKDETIRDEMIFKILTTFVKNNS